MATNITRPCFTSAHKNSAVSFLYHTRTLTTPFFSLRRFNCRFPRYISTQNKSLDNDSPGVNKSPTENDSSPINSEGTNGPNLLKQNAPKPRRSFLHKQAASVSFKKPLGPRPGSSTNRVKKLAPKITPQEKIVFGGLLQKLGVRHDGVQAKIDAQSKPLTADKQSELTELISVFDTLLQDPQKKKAAMDALWMKKYEEIHSQRTHTEKTEAKKEAPEEEKGPRRIRLSDLGYVEAATASAQDFTVSVSKAIQIVVERESEHIEFALFQAVKEGKGDMGVWEVCQERVFSMLHHLDRKMFAEVMNVDPEAVEQPETLAPRPPGPLRIPPAVPASPVVAALYPQTLLIAFRLLKTHFPRSPLISQFHSTIKEHGRISSLLGASSGLYDELIYYYWRGCKDLPAVTATLREMNQLGVSPSTKSRGLLTGIIIRQRRDLEARQRSPSEKQFFWDLPSNKEAFEELTRKDGWMDKIEATVIEEARQRDARRKFVVEEPTEPHV